MKRHINQLPIVALAVVSTIGLIVFSACSGASADSAPSADVVTTSTTTSAPTPTVVSNVPFPLDPGPSTNSQGETSNGIAGNTTTGPSEGSRHHEGDHEGREEEEGGEFGERGSIQRVTVTVTDSGLQLSTTTARAGLIEFDLTNRTANVHHVLISGNGVNGDSGAIEAGTTVHLQGTLPSGSYQISSDTTNDSSSVTLQLQ